MEPKGYGDRIAQRMAQVVGEGPRIAALADSEMELRAARWLDATRL